MRPSVVSAIKSGATSPILRPIACLLCLESGIDCRDCSTTQPQTTFCGTDEGFRYVNALRERRSTRHGLRCTGKLRSNPLNTCSGSSFQQFAQFVQVLGAGVTDHEIAKAVLTPAPDAKRMGRQP